MVVGCESLSDLHCASSSLQFGLRSCADALISGFVHFILDPTDREYYIKVCGSFYHFDAADPLLFNALMVVATIVHLQQIFVDIADFYDDRFELLELILVG